MGKQKSLLRWGVLAHYTLSPLPERLPFANQSYCTVTIAVEMSKMVLNWPNKAQRPAQSLPTAFATALWQAS